MDGVQALQSLPGNAQEPQVKISRGEPGHSRTHWSPGAGASKSWSWSAHFAGMRSLMKIISLESVETPRLRRISAELCDVSVSAGGSRVPAKETVWKQRRADGR